MLAVDMDRLFMNIFIDICMVYPRVDIRLQPSCGYIHGYCAVAFANSTEYLSVLSLYNIFMSVVLTLHFLVYLCY